jgi:hypothetical protein
MGLLKIFKKKKSLDLPPPPKPMHQVPEPLLREEQELPELPLQQPEEHIIDHEKKISRIPLPTKQKPMFISVRDYEKITQSVNTIKNKIKETEHIVAKLNELQDQEEKEFDLWRKQLADAERKITYVDEIILQAGLK